MPPPAFALVRRERSASAPETRTHNPGGSADCVCRAEPAHGRRVGACLPSAPADRPSARQPATADQVVRIESDAVRPPAPARGAVVVASSATPTAVLVPSSCPLGQPSHLRPSAASGGDAGPTVRRRCRPGRRQPCLTPGPGPAAGRSTVSPRSGRARRPRGSCPAATERQRRTAPSQCRRDGERPAPRANGDDQSPSADDVVERALRRLGRQLAVEAERRGINPWLSPS